jgi:hypothetical protein
MLKNQFSTICEMISKQMKSIQARRHVKMHKEMQKGPSFGKVNDLQLPIFACKVHCSYSPTVLRKQAQNLGEKLLRDHFPNS